MSAYYALALLFLTFKAAVNELEIARPKIVELELEPMILGISLLTVVNLFIFFFFLKVPLYSRSSSSSVIDTRLGTSLRYGRRFMKVAEGLVAEGLWKWPKWPKVYKSGRRLMKVAEASGT